MNGRASHTLGVMAGTSGAKTALRAFRPAMTRETHCLLFVMPAHSRPKDGVLSRAYVAGIHVFLRLSKTWMAGPSPAKTDEGLCILYEPGHDGRETV